MCFIYLLKANECVDLLCFFFSSRRRHTRCSRDWSSDVCSSDLVRGVDSKKRQRGGVRRGAVVSYWIGARRPRCPFRAINEKVVHLRGSKHVIFEIGRASCRERV